MKQRTIYFFMSLFLGILSACNQPLAPTSPAPTTIPLAANALSPENAVQVVEIGRFGWGVVDRVPFAPDGQTMATGHDDHRMRLWRVSDGTLLQTLTTDHQRSV